MFATTMHAISQPDLQIRTLRFYGELLCRESEWAGKLATAAFPSAASSGFAAAASLAGAASLTVDDDAAGIKSNFRDGAFDFVVNTLDEALRAVKNEVRQRKPIALGLIASPAAYLREAEERGLHPDFIAQQDTGTASPQLAAWLAERGWRPAESEVSAATVQPADIERRRWLRNLGAHQRSALAGPRWVWADAVSR